MLYSAKLAQQCSGSMTLRNRCSQHLPQTVVIPQTVLSVPPISMADVTLVSHIIPHTVLVASPVKYDRHYFGNCMTDAALVTALHMSH